MATTTTTSACVDIMCNARGCTRVSDYALPITKKFITRSNPLKTYCGIHREPHMLHMCSSEYRDQLIQYRNNYFKLYKGHLISQYTRIRELDERRLEACRQREDRRIAAQQEREERRIAARQEREERRIAAQQERLNRWVSACLDIDAKSTVGSSVYLSTRSGKVYIRNTLNSKRAAYKATESRTQELPEVPVPPAPAQSPSSPLDVGDWKKHARSIHLLSYLG
jgi:hypothetical protein